MFVETWYLCKASAVGDAAGLDCNEGNGTDISTGTMGDTNGPKGAEDKVDITTQDKTIKTSILISY